jgi:hypothetical protein
MPALLLPGRGPSARNAGCAPAASRRNVTRQRVRSFGGTRRSPAMQAPPRVSPANSWPARPGSPGTWLTTGEEIRQCRACHRALLPHCGSACSRSPAARRTGLQSRNDGGHACDRHGVSEAAAQGSEVKPLLGLGEAVGEFIEAAGVDQVALGGVIAWRQRPVAAGGVAAPDPPLRVLAPEPVKFAVPVGGALAGGHRWCLLIAGAVSQAAWRQRAVAWAAAAGAPPGSPGTAVTRAVPAPPPRRPKAPPPRLGRRQG